MNNNILYKIEKNSTQFNIVREDIGVVTATDAFTFQGLKTLFYSLKNKINFICYDLGLTVEQLSWCNTHGVAISSIKIPSVLKSIDRWQTYMKPWVIKDSPFKYTVWVDIDCIVVGDLSKTKITNKETFFTSHWFRQTYLAKNRARLYDIYPVANIEMDWINAGVMGINKDNTYILDDWINMSEKVLNNPSHFNYIAGRDEGTLNWALQKHNAKVLVVDDYRYNTYAYYGESDVQRDNIISTHRAVRLSNIYLPSIFLHTIFSTESYILHFSTFMNNTNKYWHRLP